MKLVCMHLFHLLLLLLVSCCSISCVVAISSSSKIKTLPGFQDPLPFQLETGYIGVDESDDVHLFYYFIKSERNPKEDPLMLWFSGGPGCSAFTGLVYEIGPLQYNIVEYNGSLPTFVLNPYSWTKVCSIIFLDSPVGAGFSYSRSFQGWKINDTKSAKHAYRFLRKWLNNHSEFNSNSLYIGGDSYSGMVVPLVVQEIANGIEAQHIPLINLKGYILGNPATDEKFDYNARIPFAHRMSFISDELYELTKQSCKRQYLNVDPSNVECNKNLEAASQCTKGVNIEHVLERKCIFVLPRSNRIQESRRLLQENFETLISEAQLPEFGCRTYNYLLSFYWANDDSVRDALHVKKGTVGMWTRCNTTGGLSYVKDVQSTVTCHLNLSIRGYPSLIYSGDHDMLIPYLGTLEWIKSLNFSITGDWRPWFVGSQVAGYTRTYSNRMTFATVKGAGHTAPEYKPKECLAMFSRWLSHSPL